MSFITREQYIAKTLRLAEESTSEGYKAKYWELAGRALGYLEPERQESNNIAIFQSISGDLMAFLQKKTTYKEPEMESLPEDKNESS